jgi:outer membrane protein TolC
MISLRACCCAALLAFALAGCKTGQVVSREPAPMQPLVQPAPTPPPPAQPAPAIAGVAFQESLPSPPTGTPDATYHEILGDVLSREWLAREIEARNPSLEAMWAAWQAAAQRYPQQVALDDPMLMGMIAPQSAASSLTETAYALQLNQNLPWLGKRRLRGAVADADADAAYQDAENSRLQVRLASDMAFFDYFETVHLVELNRKNVGLMDQFRETARSKYRAGQVLQQDVLQADVELADLERRQLELERMERVARARINTLLRRWPDAPLPPPPAALEGPARPADQHLLWQTALQQRPDLAALAWRVQSAEAELELAYKNFRPDFDVFGRYDTFWQPSSTQGPLRAQVGVSMNLPVYREKLRAAVCEAQFRLNQRRAEFDQRSLEIQYEVISAYEQVEESRKAVELYGRSLVPAAEQNVAAARSNYEVSKAPFLSLAQAQRQLVGAYARQLEAIVAYHRRLAELNRAVGDGWLPAQQPQAGT